MKELRLNERPLSTEEASRYMGISQSTLYKLTHKNKIPFFKPNGKKNYFLASDLDAYMLRNRHKSDYEIEKETIDHLMFGRK